MSEERPERNLPAISKKAVLACVAQVLASAINAGVAYEVIAAFENVLNHAAPVAGGVAGGVAETITLSIYYWLLQQKKDMARHSLTDSMLLLAGSPLCATSVMIAVRLLSEGSGASFLSALGSAIGGAGTRFAFWNAKNTLIPNPGEGLPPNCQDIIRNLSP